MNHKTTAASYVASGSAIVFGLNANEFAAIAGGACAILTFAVNLWFKAQHLKLARQRTNHTPDAGEYE